MPSPSIPPADPPQSDTPESHSPPSDSAPCALVTKKDRIRIALRIREVRLARKITQASMATYLGIPRSAATLLEQGRRAVTAEEIMSLCELLKVDANCLILPNLFSQPTQETRHDAT